MATDIIARGMITEYKSGANINFAENEDGSVTISASGSISSEDSVARDAINNHKSDTSNPHNVTPAQIGLGNVDNTSDLDKPISTAVQQAIDNKADKTVATTSADGLMSAEDKSKLDDADNTYALKSKYGDTTIDVGRKAGTAGGIRSTAEGWNTTASGDYSHAGGLYTKALHHYEVAYGRYNLSNSDTLFSVGDGTADDARHNAFEITTTGGKLHDKDIATTDLIPTSLPANGGNADTLDGLHADDFVNATDFNNTQIPNKVDLPAWIYENGKRYRRYMTNSTNVGTTNIPNNSINWVWYWFDGLNIFALEMGTGKYYICDVVNGVFSGWKDIYTSGYKPYVTGMVVVDSNGKANVSFGFNPSFVLYAPTSPKSGIFGSVYSARIFNATGFTPSADTYTGGLTGSGLDYIAFK